MEEKTKANREAIENLEGKTDANSKDIKKVQTNMSNQIKMKYAKCQQIGRWWAGSC